TTSADVLVLRDFRSLQPLSCTESCIVMCWRGQTGIRRPDSVALPQHSADGAESTRRMLIALSGPLHLSWFFAGRRIQALRASLVYPPLTGLMFTIATPP